MAISRIFSYTPGTLARGDFVQPEFDQLITFVNNLEATKLGTAGGTVTGALTVAGAFTAQGTSIFNAGLTVNNIAATFNFDLLANGVVTFDTGVFTAKRGIQIPNTGGYASSIGGLPTFPASSTLSILGTVNWNPSAANATTISSGVTGGFVIQTVAAITGAVKIRAGAVGGIEFEDILGTGGFKFINLPAAPGAAGTLWRDGAAGGALKVV